MNQRPDNLRRIQIGLLVSHLDDDFDSAVCQGAIEGARQLDANLVIFPGRYINGVYADQARTKYEYQYNTIFDLPSYGGFDVLLVLIGTLGSHLDEEHRKTLLAHFAGTPVITLTQQVGDYPCIKFDNRAGMASVVEHLIADHGCRRIGFVSGPATNRDAVERLNVYRSVLEKHHIAYDEGCVVYGNFSKYSGPRVEALLDANPDLDAIVFANDQMASAGYEVMEKRGIRPGRDILVTGFDDDPIAQELIPRLTTVKADPSALGHDAVVEAVSYVTTGRMEKTLIPSEMVVRNSCGCQGNPRMQLLTDARTMDDIPAYTRHVLDFLLFRCRSDETIAPTRQMFQALINACYALPFSDNIHNADLREQIITLIDRITTPEFLHLVSSDDLYTLLEFSYKTMLSRVEDPANSRLMSELFMQIYRLIAQKTVSHMQQQLDDDYFMTWQTNSITRDMLMYDVYNDEGYLSVMDKLQRLHMESGYLFTYEPVITHNKNDRWQLPQKLCLKAYHNRSDAILLKPEEQKINNTAIFTHDYMPKDRQFVMVVVPLFSKEEHYGLLLSEIEHERFHYVQSASFQLCAALKTLNLMKQQIVTQRRLRQSLIEVRENNQLLSGLSKTDELTRCLNRRGFYEEMRRKLRNAQHGAEAVMLFADLDSLKVINDLRGHAEGDFAIRSAATILRQSLGSEAIISRMGGDEFVCCDFLSGPADIEAMLQRIEAVTTSYNASHTTEKPYLIHISVGAYPFQCNDTVEIGELLSHADALLYDRKSKKKSILRQNPQNTNHHS